MNKAVKTGACPGFFSSRAEYILERNISIRGRIAPKGRENLLFPLNKICSWGITHYRGWRGENISL